MSYSTQQGLSLQAVAARDSRSLTWCRTARREVCLSRLLYETAVRTASMNAPVLGAAHLAGVRRSRALKSVLVEVVMDALRRTVDVHGTAHPVGDGNG